jgi:Protein of unknown function (DUF2934)
MKAASAPTYSVLAADYRATFQQYSNKLEALQRLMDSENQDTARIEATLLNVETARIAHSCARDRLARELIRSASELTAQIIPQPASGVSESHIRDTARLLWELAGKPEGTADGDWLKAEKLVLTAAAIGC